MPCRVVLYCIVLYCTVAEWPQIKADRSKTAPTQIGARPEARAWIHAGVLGEIWRAVPRLLPSGTQHGSPEERRVGDLAEQSRVRGRLQGREQLQFFLLLPRGDARVQW